MNLKNKTFCLVNLRLWVGIYFHDPVVPRDRTDCCAYLSFEFSGKPVRYIVLDWDVQHGRANDGWLDDRRMLHLEERFDRFDLRFVRVIRQWAPFGCQSTSSHPFGVLLLLYNIIFSLNGEKQLTIISTSSITIFNLVTCLNTYALASNTHLGHAIWTGYFQLYTELVLWNVHVRCHLASLETDTVHWQCAHFGVFRRLVHPQMQISACKPIPFESFQRKFFGPIYRESHNYYNNTGSPCFIYQTK